MDEQWVAKARSCDMPGLYIFGHAFSVTRPLLIPIRGDYTGNHRNLNTYLSCHNFSPLSSVQILLISACCLLCVL